MGHTWGGGAVQSTPSIITDLASFFFSQHKLYFVRPPTPENFSHTSRNTCFYFPFSRRSQSSSCHFDSSTALKYLKVMHPPPLVPQRGRRQPGVSGETRSRRQFLVYQAGEDVQKQPAVTKPELQSCTITISSFLPVCDSRSLVHRL